MGFPGGGEAGSGVAFVSGEGVFTACGTFIGILNGNEIWNGIYVGEIIKDDRLARKTLAALGSGIWPDLICPPVLPGMRSYVTYPAGYKDADLF